MHVHTQKYEIVLTEKHDVEKIAGIYNSNPAFLQSHMSRTSVKAEWVGNELEEMKEQGFASCKAVDTATGRIIGIIDIKWDQAETYLSLLMLHSDFRGQGLGADMYWQVERHALAQNCHCIRIDVVIKDNDKTLEFWKRLDFVPAENLELNWTGTPLPAVCMRKKLAK
ncbi:GNAT family N-acetyltransferase [Paenibacillus sp. CAU 1782]